MTEEGREGWTPQERALYDAQAQAEAWDLATRILQPWVQATREIGHPELTRVMENAFEEAEREYRRAVGEVEHLEQNAMTEEQWGVFFTDDNGGTWLVAIRGDEESAIEEARKLDEEKGLTWDENVHSVEPIPGELAAEAADQLAEGEPVLVRAL
jgi:hypothetical protein